MAREVAALDDPHGVPTTFERRHHEREVTLLELTERTLERGEQVLVAAQATEDRFVATDEVGPLPRGVDLDRLPLPLAEGELAEAFLQEHLREHGVALAEERRLARPAEAHGHRGFDPTPDRDLDLGAVSVV